MTVSMAAQLDRDMDMGDYPFERENADLEVGDRIEFRTTIVGTDTQRWLTGTLTGIDKRSGRRDVAYWVKAGRVAYRVGNRDIRFPACPN